MEAAGLGPGVVSEVQLVGDLLGAAALVAKGQDKISLSPDGVAIASRSTIRRRSTGLLHETSVSLTQPIPPPFGRVGTASGVERGS